MTTIERLDISGIRSYDPNNPVSIKFFHPLTMFVGNNGCGKTTIIEALRFVSTGHNPPDSLKGKSFVHDPLFSGDCLVKAQIKLALKTAEGKPVTIIRSFQLSQKSKTRRYQQIDATIRSIGEDGEKITATHRCLEIDNMASQIMKVSKAILSNVIFCHQEDSLWPMSDSKALKLKFDDIFASTRYTKALDKIKAAKKGIKGKVAFLEKDLQLAKSNLATFKRYKEEIGNMTTQIALLEKTIENLKSDIEGNESILTEFQKKATTLEENERRKANLIFRIKSLQSERNSLQTKVTRHIDKPEAVLTETKISLKDKAEKLENAVEKGKKQIEALEDTLNALKTEHELNIQNMGKMQAEEDRNARQREKMLQTTEAVAKRYDVTVAAGSDVAQAESVLSFVSGELIKSQTKLRQIDDKHHLEKQTLRTDLEKTQNFLSTSTQILKQLKHEISESEKTALKLNANEEVLKRKLKSIDASKEKIERANEEISQIERMIEKEGFERLIAEAEKENSNLSEKLNAVEMELDLLRIQSNSEESLKIKSQNLKRSRAQYEGQLKTTKNAMKNALGNEPKKSKEMVADSPQKNLDLMKNRKNDVIEAKNKLFGILKNNEANLGICLGKIAISEKAIEKIKSEIDKNEQSVPSDVPLYSVENDLKEAQTSLNKIQSKILFEKGASCIYKNIIEKIEETQNCPICERKLFKKDLQKVVAGLNEKIDSFGNNETSQKLKKTAEELKTKTKRLSDLLPIKENLESLKTRLEEHNSHLDQYKTSSLGCKKDIESLRTQESNIIDREKFISLALEEIKELCRLHSALSRDESELEQEKYRLNAVSDGKNDFDIVKNEKNTLLAQIQENHAKIKGLRAKKDQLIAKKHKTIMDFTKLKDEESELLNVKAQFEKIKIAKTANDQKRSKLGKKIAETEEKVTNEYTKNVEYVKELITSQTAKYQISRRAVEEKITILSGNKSQLFDLIEGVSRYDSLETQRREIMELFGSQNEKKQNLESTIKSLAIETKSNAEELKTTLSSLENVDVLLQLKVKERELKNFVDEKDETEKEIQNLTETEKIVQKFTAAKERNDELKKILFEAEGRKGAYKDQAVQVATKMKENASFDDIEEKFDQTFINLETSLVAQKDLDIFEKALDQALIKFHSMKMEEINRNLRKYWKLVYRGSDIDYIEIVSDSKDLAVTANTNRNYDYFVIMSKGKVRLEMKGRCSAGQKVLACLLIRLALAESFCGDCNILALDEPTTNLDEANFRSFGESLNELVRAKSESADFQLLLITHNEKFAEILAERGSVDAFYRVYKDDQNYSKVKEVRGGFDKND